MAKYYLGIDGGGTKTEFLLSNADLTPLRRIFKGASNPIDVGIEKSTEVLKNGITEIMSDLPFRSVSVFSGIAGSTAYNASGIFSEFFDKFGFSSFSTGNDGLNAIAASLDESDGICLIMGTGICAFEQKNCQITQKGGLGYLFDKGGSGYDLGCDAIRYALLSEQGVLPQTVLTSMIKKKLEKQTVKEAIPYFYSIGKEGIASFAEILLKAFEVGDKTAREIFENNMQKAGELITSCMRDFGSNKVKIRLCGGISRHPAVLPALKGNIKSDKQIDIALSEQTSAMGAVILARRYEKC